MNICFLITNHITPFSGGVEAVTYRLCRIFKSKGNSIYSICANKDDGIDGNEDSSLMLPDGDEFSNRNIEFIESFTREANIDIIINQSDHINQMRLCSSIYDKTDIKVISCIHIDILYYKLGKWDDYDTVDFFYHGFFNRLSLRLKYLLKIPFQMYNRNKYYSSKYRYLYEHSDAIVLLSNAFIEPFANFTGIESTSKLYHISNPLNLSSVKSSHNDKNIMWVGRMTKATKRPDRMIKIWERIYKVCPDWKLYMIGDGDLKEPLENYCRHKQIRNVVFTGLIDPNPYYEKASILCATSSSEGFGLTLTEALQSGVIPCAYKWNESIKDIIDDGNNGFIIEKGNTKQFADILCKLMNDEYLRSKIHDNILKSYSLKQFSSDTIYDEWCRLFETLNGKQQRISH